MVVSGGWVEGSCGLELVIFVFMEITFRAGAGGLSINCWASFNGGGREDSI